MPQEQNLYDTVAYPGGANFKSHPDNLSVMGILYGLEPAPVATCRVLEIGCSEGHNLVPMAYAIPGGRFVGFDLAAEPIAAGQRRIERLGLTNVQLMQANLMDLDENLGTFDYIIAHGLYAWLPEVVRDGLLAVIKKLLAPMGIAFVSYNTYPGGHIRRMARDMLKHHVAGSGDPVKDANESITYLQYIVESMSEKEEIRPALERELKQMKRKGPYITFHDEMAEHYEPVYYSTFAHHALRHGLEPFCDAEFTPPVDACFDPEISKIANGISANAIQREQTFDFIRMRKYRETLLCHAGTQPGERPDMDMDAIHRLSLASWFFPDAEAEANNPGGRCYRTHDGSKLEVLKPALIAILDELSAAWPTAIPMPQLRAMMEAKGFLYDEEFVGSLFRLILNRVIGLHTWQTPVAAGMPTLPRTSAYCRDAAEHGTKAISLLHASIDLSAPILRMFVLMLDGTRDPSTVMDEVRKNQPDVPEEKLVADMGPALIFLYRMGFFVAEDFDPPRQAA